MFNPILQASEKMTDFHIFDSNSSIFLAETSTFALSNLAVMLSIPGAFPLSSLLTQCFMFSREDVSLTSISPITSF